MKEKIILYTQLPKQDTIKEYIESLFSYIGGTYNKNYKGCVSTFKNKSCTELENGPGRRSFEDILSMVWSKYPEASEKEVAKAVYESFEDDKLVSLYCKDISKNVFLNSSTFKDDLKHKLCWNTFLPNEDISHKGKGEYSIKDILDLAGIEEYEYKK